MRAALVCVGHVSRIYALFLTNSLAAWVTGGVTGKHFIPLSVRPLFISHPSLWSGHGRRLSEWQRSGACRIHHPGSELQRLPPAPQVVRLLLRRPRASVTASVSAVWANSCTLCVIMSFSSLYVDRYATCSAHRAVWCGGQPPVFTSLLSERQPVALASVSRDL